MDMDFKTFLDGFHSIEDAIPFNRHLGLTLTRFDESGVEVGLPMRPELVGNFTAGNLHGGVISATLDLVGGMVAVHAAIEAGYLDSQQKTFETFAGMGTIDLRVDYLRRAFGERFIGTGHALRVGRKVTVTRMELHNEEGLLLAVGTGTYRMDAG